MSRGNGNFFTRRIVFATESPHWPTDQFTQGGCGPNSFYRSKPSPLSDVGNRLCIARLFGGCRGPNTIVRVRDLLYGKPGAPGVTILENRDVHVVKGSSNGTINTWPRQNYFTPTKKGARLEYKPRKPGVFGPELRELSNAHVYVLTVYVAGYIVHDLPVPTPEGLPQGTKRRESDSEDSDMVDMSDLNLSTPVRGESAKKKIKTEPVEQTGVLDPPIDMQPRNIRVGREVAALDAVFRDNNPDPKDPEDETPVFEVRHTSLLRIYIYEKTVNRV